MNFINYWTIILYAFVLVLNNDNLVTSQVISNDYEEDPAVSNYRTYLKIDSSHPNPESGYNKSIEWLREQAAEIGLEFNLLDLGAPNLFALWMTWPGSDPSLKSIMFDSHMDTVAVDPSRWIHPPFDAYKDENGNIFARGASDTKCTTMGTLEAIRRLKNNNFQPLRTIHVTIMPDEENGGHRGVAPFVKTETFKRLNVGLTIEEGNPGADNSTLTIGYGEKSVWQFNYTATGFSNHAATFPQFTASNRLQVVIDKMLEFRANQYEKLNQANTTLEEITTVNLARLGGGDSNNAIPGLLWASFDMRIWPQPDLNFTHLEEMLENIRSEAEQLSSEDESVTLSYIMKSVEVSRTVANSSNPWWNAMQQTCEDLGLNCVWNTLSAITDGRHIRREGIDVFNFSPFPNSPSTAHQDNEFMNENYFLEGINRYEAFIRKLAMFPEEKLRKQNQSLLID